MKEEGNTLRILEETLGAIKHGEVVKLKELSDQTIHTASIAQDPDNIAVAVIVYSISKIIERPSYRAQRGWDKFYKSLIMGLENSIVALKRKDEAHFGAHLEAIRKKIEGLSGNLKKYIQDVFLKASINKASKIYEHGISMEKTAKLLGISMWEIAGYAGQRLQEQDLGKTISVKQRIKFAMEIFSG